MHAWFGGPSYCPALVVAGVWAEYHDALERARDKDPTNRLALRLLAACAKADVIHAEEVGDHNALAKALMALDRYDVEKRHERFRHGTGKLSLKITLPDGQEIPAFFQIFPLLDKGALRIPASEPWLEFSTLGTGPVVLDIHMASYKVVVRAKGFPDIIYPVHITRQRHWEGVVRLRIPPKGFVYVPGGQFEAGKKGVTSIGALPHGMRMVEDFFIGKCEVTREEWLQFRPDAKAPTNLRWPLADVSWHDAKAYCAWRSQRDGVQYDLPTEDQWEKAERGVDGRVFPWGQKSKKEACRGTSENPAPVNTYPLDCSIYGALDTAGNVSELTNSRDEGFVWYRGGNWRASMELATTTPEDELSRMKSTPLSAS